MDFAKAQDWTDTVAAVCQEETQNDISRDLLAAFIARRTAVRKHVRLELTKLYRANCAEEADPVTHDTARARLAAASMIPTILRQPSGRSDATASTQPATPSTNRAAHPLYIAARERQSDEDSESDQDDETEAVDIASLELPGYDGRSADEITSDEYFPNDDSADEPDQDAIDPLMSLAFAAKRST